MGAASVTMHPRIMARVAERYRGEIRLVGAEDAGPGMTRFRVMSKHLAAGYHGDAKLAVVDGKLKFLLVER